jgi:hypothetical protein
MTDVYRNDISSIEDPEERAAALQPILDFVDSKEPIDDEKELAVKSIASVMESAKDQFANLVSGHFSFICQFLL